MSAGSGTTPEGSWSSRWWATTEACPGRAMADRLGVTVATARTRSRQSRSAKVTDQLRNSWPHNRRSPGARRWTSPCRFRMLGRDGHCGGGGEALRREGVHQHVADDARADAHDRNHREPAAQAALARRAGAELVRSPVVHGRPTVLLEGFFLMFTADSVRESHQIRRPFGEGQTSPVAVEDVARVLAARLANPRRTSARSIT